MKAEKGSRMLGLPGRVLTNRGIPALWLAVALLLAWPGRAGAEKTAGEFLGFSVSLAGKTAAELAAESDRLQEAGVRWVRVGLNWDMVEPRRGQYEWSFYDRLVEEIAGLGMRPVFVLGPTAQWASRGEADLPAEVRGRMPPADLADWRRYVAEAVRHFRGRVRYWQLWERPDFQHYRGTDSAWRALLKTASEAARKANPDCRLILPEPGGPDLGFIASLATGEAWNWFDILGLSVNPDEPEAMLLPAAVLREEILAKLSAAKRKALWITGWSRPFGRRAQSQPEPGLATRLGQASLLALASGIEVIFWPADSAAAENGPSATPREELFAEAGRIGRQVAKLRYAGMVRLGPGLRCLTFQQGDQIMAALWAGPGAGPTAEREGPDPRRANAIGIAAGLTGALGALLVPEPALWAVTAIASGAAAVIWPLWSSAEEPGSSGNGSAVGTVEPTPAPAFAEAAAGGPAFIAGPLPAGWQQALRPGFLTREDVLALRGGPDLRQVDRVWMDLGGVTEEFGLRHRSLRHFPGGQTQMEERGGRKAVRTAMSNNPEEDNPWIYFDVDDGFLYFARGRVPVMITAEVYQGRGPKRLGLKLCYNSTRGYRFSPWQWVESGQGWQRLSFVLEDADFANKQGYDFRLDAKGSKEDLYVAAVEVQKAPAAP